SPMVTPSLPRLTRQQGGPFLRENGFPISDKQFVKACLPSKADPPPVAAWWGHRALYDPHRLLEWAHARLKQTPPSNPKRRPPPPAGGGLRSAPPPLPPARTPPAPPCPPTGRR